MNSIICALHGHSKYSDGQNTPANIIKSAVKQNITYLALTDHDNVNGIPQLYENAKNTTVIPIAGIEFLTKDGDLIALKPSSLTQAIPFLKWCSTIKTAKMSALDIIITGLKKYNCLFIIPHPGLFVHSLNESHLREIYLSLTPSQREHIAIEINNGATQILNNQKRLDRILKLIKKYPFHLINGPDYHHTRWLTLGSSHLPQHAPSYNQFYKYFTLGKFSHQTPPKLTFKQTILIYLTQAICLLNSNLDKIIARNKLHRISPQLATLLTSN